LHRFFQNNIFLLSIIGAAAIILSAVSYTFYISASAQLVQSASEEISSNARIQAHDLATSLDNKINSLKDNLQILSTSQGIREGDEARGKQILSAAHQSTSDLTDGYFWLDKDGILIWSSNLEGDPAREEQFKDFDLSYRSYFSEVKRTLEPYFSESLEPVEGPATIFISYPIFGLDGTFHGVVATGVKTEVLGKVLASELSPEMQGTVGLVDKSGVILYSSEAASIGKAVFADDYQAHLATLYTQEQVDKLNSFVTRSLASQETFSTDLETTDGTKITLAYSPLFVDSQRAATLYVVAPHAFPTSVTSVIAQQQLISVIETATIAAIAIGIAFIVISWNKNLARTVKEKTAELKTANDNLAQALEKSERSEKLQKEFINIAAHELRTPIQPLLGVAEILEGQFGSEKAEILVSRAEVDMIIRNAKRLERLSSDILQVSRIESESLVLHKESTDLGDKVRTVVQDEQKRIPSDKPVKLIYDQQVDGSILAEIDRARVYEVLSNLISNAIKFTDSGTITVRCERREQEAVISVSDTGVGIDSLVLPRLFTKFATSSDSGTGLGLFISKSIVEAHGGRIWAYNNEGGKGATFTFALPALTTPSTKENTQSKSDQF
jgi:signal transduction histidine kinase